jgi:hypothetical protein
VDGRHRVLCNPSTHLFLTQLRTPLASQPANPNRQLDGALLLSGERDSRHYSKSASISPFVLPCHDMSDHRYSSPCSFMAHTTPFV